MSSPATKKIAILGGGISGLSCASQLLSRHKQSSSSSSSRSYELEVTVFDTGRLRPGGRCSSRLVGDKPPVVKGQPQQQPKRRACDDAGLEQSNRNNNGGTSDNTTPKNIYKALLANTNQSNNDSMARVLNSCGAIDHAAQIISVPNVDNNNMDQFQKQIDNWVQNDVLESFPKGSVCELLDDGENGNKQLKLETLNGDMWYGKGGMGNIPLVMRDYCLSFNGFGDNYTGQSFRIAQDVWVSPSNGVKYIGNRNNDDNNNNKHGSDDREELKWELRAGNRSLGKYHNLVIAHNGKCADRIMSRTPAKAFHSLLRTKFAPYVPQWGGREMTLNSIYSLVFAIKSSGGDSSPIARVISKLGNTKDDAEVYTVMIKNEPTLRLLSCNTLKHHHGQNPNSQSNIEIYTLLSSPKFGKQFKGPQENLPFDLQEKVVLKMLSNLESSLKLEQGDVSDLVVDLKLQLWGAAVPMNTWSTSSINNNNGVDGFVYDATYQVGAAGDWILDPSIAGAWESGRRLADWILQHHDDDESEEKGNNNNNNWSVGLPDLTNNSNDREKNGKFVPSRVALESGIGSIPPSPNSKFEFPSNDESQRRQGGRGGRGRGGRGRGRGRGGRGGRQGGGRNNDGNRARRSNGRTTSQTVS